MRRAFLAAGRALSLPSALLPCHRSSLRGVRTGFYLVAPPAGTDKMAQWSAREGAPNAGANPEFATKVPYFTLRGDALTAARHTI